MATNVLLTRALDLPMIERKPTANFWPTLNMQIIAGRDLDEGIPYTLPHTNIYAGYNQSMDCYGIDERCDILGFEFNSASHDYYGRAKGKDGRRFVEDLVYIQGRFHIDLAKLSPLGFLMNSGKEVMGWELVSIFNATIEQRIQQALSMSRR